MTVDEARKRSREVREECSLKTLEPYLLSIDAALKTAVEGGGTACDRRFSQPVIPKKGIKAHYEALGFTVEFDTDEGDQLVRVWWGE